VIKFTIFLIIISMGLMVTNAYAQVEVPQSFRDSIIPGNITESGPASVANTFITNGFQPVVALWGGWFFPIASLWIFVAYYSAKEDFIYASIPGILVALGGMTFLTAYPVAMTIVSVLMILGYGGAIFLGIRSRS
jgi:hypothetical protein